MIRHLSTRVLLVLLFSIAITSGIDCRLVAADKPGQPTVDKPLPPEEAATTMQLPDGFKATLFAGEPDVQQPIGFCIDDRGRLWVAEAYSYPDHTDQPGKDRILIFEDSDNDGRHDKRTVFYEGLNYVSGIEVGFGGAWVMSPPYFYFIPDKNHDDVPDGEPEILLDGFGTHANSHNIANGFGWGPDGWLYGTHGRTNWSMIGKPGAKDAERQRFDGGVWRYHPVRHEWEPYCDGTTNPWGIDWDEYGEAFMSNCVNPHLFHVIQGAHYEPWRGRQSSQYAYDRIESIADHLHFVDGSHTTVGTDEVESLGGGHAHCGIMVYQGTNWPAEYRGRIFMHNVHGRRINQEILERKGSGYVARHADDFMISRDPWFMGVTMQYGPDGGVFVIDWSDTGECHSVRNTRKETGRIFKITYGDEPPGMPRFMGTLNEMVQSDLEWHVRRHRRVYLEQKAGGRDFGVYNERIRQWFANSKSPVASLRLLWALHSTGGTDHDFLSKQLDHQQEHLRAWAIRLLCEDRKPPASALKKFADLGANDPSPLVRRYLANALRRLPHEQRWDTAAALVAHAKDADDQNLPLLYWYAIEPLVNTNLARFTSLGADSKIPLIRRHTARRVTEYEKAKDLPQLFSYLQAGDSHSQADLLSGIIKGLDELGLQELDIPNSWNATYAALQASGVIAIRQAADRLALRFNDPIALDQLNHRVRDRNAQPTDRRTALSALIDKGIEDLDQLLLSLLEDPQVQDLAIRGLAKCDHPDIAPALIKLAPTLDATARRDAVQTLASRLAWAAALLDAVDAGTLDPSDIGAFAARQMQNLGDKKLTARLTATWGDLRKPSKDKEKAIAGFRKKLTPDSIAAADPRQGRVVFQNLCASCHKMFGEGGDVGPEITGSQRKNIDYLLENLIDPSAAVSKDYQLEVIETRDGRFLSGFIRSQNDNALTLQSINEQVVVPLADIAKRTPAEVSIMPEGLLQTLTTEQIRDLFAYLSSPGQVEPAEK